MQKNQVAKLNRDAYDKIAGDFLLKRECRLDELKFLIKYLKKGDKILDLGCGWGRLYQVFVGQSIKYVGADQSKELLKIARKKFPKAKFISAEMTKLPFKNGEFDKIFCILTLHHLLSLDLILKALREMRRVLKRDGKLIMSNWNLRGDWCKKKMGTGDYIDIGDNNLVVPWKNNAGKVLAKRYYHAFSPLELKKLLNQAGFKVEKQYYERWGKRRNKKEGANIVTVATFPSPNTPPDRSTASR